MCAKRHFGQEEMRLVEHDRDLSSKAFVSFDESPQTLRVQVFDGAESEVAVICDGLLEFTRPQFEVVRPPIEIFLQG